MSFPICRRFYKCGFLEENDSFGKNNNSNVLYLQNSVLLIKILSPKQSLHTVSVLQKLFIIAFFFVSSPGQTSVFITLETFILTAEAN